MQFIKSQDVIVFEMSFKFVAVFLDERHNIKQVFIGDTVGFDLVESFGGNLTAEQALVVYDKRAHGVFGIVIEHRHG